MSFRQEFPPKPISSTLNVTFDFTSDLASGGTISTKVVTATVYSGADAAPSGIISGAATSSGNVVTQLLTGGTLGVVYQLLCTITTSNGQTLVKAGYLAVVPNL